MILLIQVLYQINIDKFKVIHVFAMQDILIIIQLKVIVFLVIQHV